MDEEAQGGWMKRLMNNEEQGKWKKKREVDGLRNTRWMDEEAHGRWMKWYEIYG